MVVIGSSRRDGEWHVFGGDHHPNSVGHIANQGSASYLESGAKKMEPKAASAAKALNFVSVALQSNLSK